jgi:ribonuclease-3
MLSRIFKRFKRRKPDQILNSLLSDKKISKLESSIKYKIKSKPLFIQALLHRSYLEETKEELNSNERLEFLGDAVLSVIVAEYLYFHFPENDEGFLTKVRAKIVNRNVLADAAEAIGLADFIIVGKNLMQSFRNGSKTVLSDAFEAIVGAIYLDSDIDEVKKFVNRILIKPITKQEDFLRDENYKSQLLEYAQSRRMENPVYIVVNEEGPQHNRSFTVKVLIGENEFGTGRGRNKKSAEQDAAKAAMIKFLQEN